MLEILVDFMIEPDYLDRLRAMPDVRVEVVETADDQRPLPTAVLAGKEVLFCSLPPTNLPEMNKLRWIQIASAGFSQLFEWDLPTRGVIATNAKGVFDTPIAEWNLCMMVALLRNLRSMIRNQQDAIWDRSPEFQRELRGLTVGLWGYGGIGRETGRLTKAMGLRVHVFSRTGIGPAGNVYYLPGTGDPDGVLPDRVFLPHEKAEFLSGLDFLILAMPQTNSTTGIIGECELQMLPRYAYLLNPARGPLVQEKALIRALEERWIGGAAIDTHYIYPLPPDHPLWGFANVILTPHISGSNLSPHYVERTWDVMVRNVERYRAGAPLLNALSAGQLRGE